VADNFSQTRHLDRWQRRPGPVAIAQELRKGACNTRSVQKQVTAKRLISPDQALKLVVDNVQAVGLERVSIRQALGRILGEPIHVPRDIPGFDNSAMDGFAVRSDDLADASRERPVELKIVETIAAGSVPKVELGPRQAARIMTGAPIPRGADAVVPIEQTRSSNDAVEVLVSVASGWCVRRRGEDLREGDLVLAARRRLRAADVGLLASLNCSMVDVYRQPRVAIVCTGDELVDINQQPSGAQVVNSNAYALAAAVSEAGGEATLLRVARDRPSEIRERFCEALCCDAILSTGGVSVGQFDHVEEVLRELGIRELFHGVSQRPGKPLMFGLLERRPVFGLPGNPVSALVCFELYAKPALRKMGGWENFWLPKVTALCAQDIKTAAHLTEFIRVKIERRDDQLYATASGEQGSAILSTLSRADGLLIAPAKKTILPRGSQVEVLLLSCEAALAYSPGFEV
jgi:molybdopterin molybdotransferase